MRYRHLLQARIHAPSFADGEPTGPNAHLAMAFPLGIPGHKDVSSLVAEPLFEKMWPGTDLVTFVVALNCFNRDVAQPHQGDVATLVQGNVQVLRLIAPAQHLPASGDAVLLKSGFLVEAHHLDCGFQADALNSAKTLQGVLTQPTANPLTLMFRPHREKADEGIARAMCHRCDASHWNVVWPGQPGHLAIGVVIDLDAPPHLALNPVHGLYP